MRDAGKECAADAARRENNMDAEGPSVLDSPNTSSAIPTLPSSSESKPKTALFSNLESEQTVCFIDKVQQEKSEAAGSPANSGAEPEQSTEAEKKDAVNMMEVVRPAEQISLEDAEKKGRLNR
ncbi:unnamed protein product [Caenorhabditis auriculariae]|uniref:Uncharacterized protein n=1 Tax=Caenorhabditis auriculariae TaxID=2777116 RepID=A0A8S1HDA4_9PELO|nr:unnamed protein product [Caenorhabditis auriculariae]